MDDRTGNLTEMGFANGKSLLAGLSHDMIGNVFGLAADVVLIVNSDAMIIDTCFNEHDLFHAGGRGWRGQSIYEIVTVESKEKIEELLSPKAGNGKTPRRQINHLLPDAEDMPVSYISHPLNDAGDIIFFGRAEKQIVALQRRMMSSQLSMEREVGKLRSGESRYRAAFQLSMTAQLIVDAASLRILDINAAATTLLGKPGHTLENKKFLGLFDEADGQMLHKLLLALVNRQDDGKTRAKLSSGSVLDMQIITFRQDGRSQLLLNIDPAPGTSDNAVPSGVSKTSDIFRHMPDAFVATTSKLTISMANEAFFDLLNVSGLNEVDGMQLERFFERPAVDCKVLLSNLNEHGVVNRFASSMKSKFGQPINVEIAACQLDVDGETTLGFWIRPNLNLAMTTAIEPQQTGRSNEQIANLVGHMPLKDIVRETTEVIERLCIETALELTKNNRASAAEMLGLSRQSLYSKLANTKDSD